MMILSILLTFLSNAFTLNQEGSSDPVLSCHVFDERIKTVQLYREGWNLSYPVIKLNSGEKLALHFDLLGDDIDDFYYSFIHCDKDWNRSDIFHTDYLEGFPENPLEDYRPSFNTTVHYTHYKLSFPNDRINFRLSGNYIILIHPSNDPEHPVLSYRFMVTEDLAGIEISAHRPRMTADLNKNQQIDFNVTFPSLRINDPYRDVFAFILQNGRWDNARKNLKPAFTSSNQLKYNSLTDVNVFPGGNEFRYFDIKSIRYQSQFVRKIDFLISNYHVYLAPSDDREFKPYFYWEDFNGKYYIAIQEEKNPDTDADYVYVYFTLPSSYPVEGGRMYISGAFSNWEFNTSNLMSYNAEEKAYESIILLKQGWYNYEYVVIPSGSGTPGGFAFEGSHWETENDYLIITYFRDPATRYDRLTGIALANTRAGSRQ